MSGECDVCGEHCMDCKCDLGKKRRAIYWALERMRNYVRNLDADSLQRVCEGQPVFTQEMMDDWSLTESKYPSPYHRPFLRLQLRVGCNGRA